LKADFTEGEVIIQEKQHPMDKVYLLLSGELELKKQQAFKSTSKL
jgi:hypothetical protein